MLFRHVLGSLVGEFLAAMSFGGPCGAHAAGPGAVVLLLFCMIMAVIASPASWWVLAKLFLVFSLAVVLGALPGVALWLVLIVRKVVRVAKAGDSR